MQQQSLDSIETPVISTAHLSFLLGVPERTLHSWSSKKSGPIQPIKIGKHLKWRTADVRELLAAKN